MVLLRPTDLSLAQRGLRCMLAGAERAPNEPAPAAREAHLRQFLAYATDHHIDLTRQVLAMDANNCVVGVCVWVPAPGRTAALFAANLQEHPQMAAATRACANAVLADAKAAGLVLVQVMLEPTDGIGEDTFTGAGLARLATLLYMERKTPLMAPAVHQDADVELLTYAAARHAEFASAIAASYDQTRDCPALSGLRDIDDVMKGHQAIGTFQADLWTLVKIDGQAVGCLLLAELAARSALEIVYLGLAPAARGRGLGRLLMQRTLATAVRRSLSLVSLAVDESNEPALKLYRRFGLSTVARRVALIRKLD